MNPAPLPWLGRPGLAGGIDKDGSRAGELLALGFGSVEFGTVTPLPQPGHDPGLELLVSRLAVQPPRPAGATAIGIGVGYPPSASLAALPAAWLAGLEAAWPVADYVSFNLSARAYRPLLASEHLAFLTATLVRLVTARNRLPRQPALVLKLPLGSSGEALPPVAEAAAAAGFDALTTVLPEGVEGFHRLARLSRRLQGGPALIAVGGIRSGRDVAAARAAGAAGVQVHRAFAELGPDCLPLLLENPARPGNSPS